LVHDKRKTIKLDGLFMFTHVSTIIEKVRSNARKEGSEQFNLFADFNGIDFEEGSL
jgi:hypothetical protein